MQPVLVEAPPTLALGGPLLGQIADRDHGRAVAKAGLVDEVAVQADLGLVRYNLSDGQRPTVLPGLEADGRVGYRRTRVRRGERKTELDGPRLSFVDEAEVDAVLGEVAEADGLHGLGGHADIRRPDGVDRSPCRAKRAVVGQCDGPRREERDQKDSQEQRGRQDLCERLPGHCDPLGWRASVRQFPRRRREPLAGLSSPGYQRFRTAVRLRDESSPSRGLAPRFP